LKYISIAKNAQTGTPPAKAREAATPDMTPSDQAKALGCKSLKQVSDCTKKSVQTLINWHRDSPELFAIVCAGVASRAPESESNATIQDN
jgi:hypothetical protein